MGYDTFGRIRVATPLTVFDSKLLYDNQALLWDEAETSGSGTSTNFTANKPYVSMSVTANTAGTRVRQTFQYHNYQPGLTQFILMTVIPGTPVAGIKKRWGYFDDNNGLYFELDGLNFYVVVRSKVSGSVVNTRTQVYPTFDVSKDSLFYIEFGWLGIADIHFGTVFDDDYKDLRHLHFDNDSEPYMSTPNLPLRYEIINDGTGGASTLKCVCSTVMSNGGQQINGNSRSISREVTPLVTLNSTALFPLIAIRLASTKKGVQIVPEKFSLICTSTSAIEYLFVLNPTFVGTSVAFSTLTNSGIEYINTHTNATTITGGTVIDGGYFQSTNEGTVLSSVQTKLRIGFSISGTSDVIVLAVRRVTGTTETIYGTLVFREV